MSEPAFEYVLTESTTLPRLQQNQPGGYMEMAIMSIPFQSMLVAVDFTGPFEYRVLKFARILSNAGVNCPA